MISVSINEVQGKLNLSGLHRWFKQVYCFGDRLGSLAVDSLGLRGYGSRANSWMPGKPQQHLVGTEKKKTKERETAFSVNLWMAKITAYASVFSY